ncbi:MAG: hypothetical protein H8E27_14790 [Verrucomicrobia subdivision 3 bacterium]|nr:hypothetical protein [Limisphaerales bacterium]
MNFLLQHISHPVALRDLRQINRTHMLPVFLLAVLAVSFLLPLGVYVWGLMFGLDSSAPFESSNPLFMGGLSFLLIATVGTIYGLHPITELSTPHREFIRHGMLTPEALLAGRRRAGWVILALGHFATLPCLILALSMGEGSVEGYLITQLLALLMSVVLLEFSLGSVAIGAGAALPLTFVGFGLAMFLHGMLEDAGFLEFFHGTHRNATASDPFNWFFLAVLSVSAFCCINVANHALMRPIRSNREMPLRGSITVAWIVFALALGYNIVTKTTVDKPHMIELVEVLGWITVAIIVLGMLPMAAAIDPLPKRVRKEIPKSRWQRGVMYPFFSGPDSSLVWGMGMLIISAFAVWGIFAMLGESLSTSADYSERRNLKAPWICGLFVLSAAVQLLVLMQNKPGTDRKSIQTKWGIWLFSTLAVMCVLIAICKGILEVAPELEPMKQVFSLPVFGALLGVQLIRSRKFWARRWREFKPVEL